MNIPEKVKNIVRGIDSDAEIILFGSRAKGAYRSSSDWDFLILLSKPSIKELKEQIRRELYDLELETDSIITSLIHSKDEWAMRENTVIYKEIATHGIVA